jgi:dimethylhistidine N-methyltransferase
MTTIDDELLKDTVRGLSSTPRTLHCKYFYDERGSELFEQITDTPEYYPTRTEVGILRDQAEAIAKAVGPDAHVVEFGSGSGLKTEILLDSLQAPASYTPVEISESALDASVAVLRRKFPALVIEPLCADYTQHLEVDLPEQNRLVFFPGSTIGNFERDEAREFLARAARFVGKGGGLLIGADLKKDPQVLHAAYNDAAGVTAEFNLNLLHRLNRDIGADFQVERWQHYAHYAPEMGRIEVFLVSLADQVVQVGEHEFAFATGDAIRTEYSHKYTRREFEAIAQGAGFTPSAFWTDASSWFGVFYFEV